MSHPRWPARRRYSSRTGFGTVRDLGVMASVSRIPRPSRAKPTRRLAPDRQAIHAVRSELVNRTARSKRSCFNRRINRPPCPSRSRPFASSTIARSMRSRPARTSETYGRWRDDHFGLSEPLSQRSQGGRRHHRVADPVRKKEGDFHPNFRSGCLRSSKVFQDERRGNAGDFAQGFHLPSVRLDQLAADDFVRRIRAAFH